MNRSQTNQQLNHPPTLKLLKAGRAPPLLTTRVILASAVISSETKTTADSAVGNTSSSSAVASPVNSKAALPIVKLLGKLRGGMPGERTENLVISCYECNQEREIKTLAYSRPFARRRVPCDSCGGRFFHPDWGGCSICGAVPPRLEKPSERMKRPGNFWQAIKRALMIIIRLLAVNG